jgi:transcriptional regulator with XRE-family HTH domain
LHQALSQRLELKNDMVATTGHSDLTDSIALSVKTLRLSLNYSLDQLALHSGVSRSMISSIERGASNATAVVLDRLASALGVSLTELLEAGDLQTAEKLMVRRAEQKVWIDPASGYQRRTLSPALSDTSLRLMEVTFPAKARVAYESDGKSLGQNKKLHQQIWILAGKMEVTRSTELFCLSVGDCLAFRIDQPVVFYNPGQQDARYLVAQV